MSIKSIFKHTAVYGISSSLNRAAGFFLIPVYTRYLEPEEYGILALCQAMISLLTILFEMGMNSALLRYFFEYDREKDKKSLMQDTGCRMESKKDWYRTKRHDT